MALHSSSPAELKARLEADRRGCPYILYRPHPDEQRILELEPGTDRATIGRQPACDIALPEDPSVSRVHAVLERIGEEWTLVDDGSSRNGSFVNGQRMHGRQLLRDGDVVRVGDTQLVFRAHRDHAVAETLPATAAPPAISGAQRGNKPQASPPSAGRIASSHGLNCRISTLLVSVSPSARSGV